MNELYHQYQSRVRFLLVYIREAHPIDGWQMNDNVQAGIFVTDPTSLQQRNAVAETACSKLHLDFPAIVDGMDNRVGTEYAGWPDRIYGIGTDGKIGFKTGPGPWGFDADGLADYLKQIAGPPDAADAAPSAAVPAPETALPAPGKPAPAVEGAGLDGHPVSLAALRGKVVLLDFWATWCAPCRSAIPGLQRLYRRYHDRGLEIVGVSIDGGLTGTAPDRVRSFIKQMNVPWPQLVENKGWDGPTVTRYGINDPPTTVLVGKDGNVLLSGGPDAVSPEALEKAIQDALAVAH